MITKSRLLTILLMIIAYSLWSMKPAGRVYWPYLITSLMVALIVLRDRGLPFKESIKNIFSPKIWFHATATNEYILVIIVLAVLVLSDQVHFLSIGFITEQFTAILEWCGMHISQGQPTLTASVCYIVANFLAFDFASWLYHFLMHKNKYLWEFHKVHHAAQVLTPITSLRQHPVELIWSRIVHIFFIGAVTAVFIVFYPFVSTIAFVFETNIIFFILFFFGSALAHSHVWVSFGKFEKFFLSPAMHQVHHSNQEKHFNKNYGLSLSIWDRMFGTAYLTKEYEEIEFGLGVENKKFLTLKGLLWMPFVRSYRKMLKRRKPKTDSDLIAEPAPEIVSETPS